MAYQTPITIKKLLDNMDERRYVLPYIPIEPIWEIDNIIRFVDGLMHGYPINPFLCWQIDNEFVNNYKFFEFILHYEKQVNPSIKPKRQHNYKNDLTIILDGQQILTALNIGFGGSYTSVIPSSRQSLVPSKSLYLNLRHINTEIDDERFWFQFLTEHEASYRSMHHYWYRVGDILSITNEGELTNAVRAIGSHHQLGPQKVLRHLFNLVHSKPLISFYEVQYQNLHGVWKDFIQINRRESYLLDADIFLNIAAAQWDERDARGTIYDLTDDLNSFGNRFRFGSSFVMKSALMLADIEDVRFRIANVNYNNMKKIEDQWADISNSIFVAVDLASDFGLSGDNLGDENSLIPIAYYAHVNTCRRNVRYRDILESDSYVNDRHVMRTWLFKSLLKRDMWRLEVDELLIELRSVINKSASGDFPVRDLEAEMRCLGKELLFDEEELEDLVDSRFDSHRSSLLLMLLFPFVEVKKKKFHVDHVFPRNQMTLATLAKDGLDASEQLMCLDALERLPNLQILEGDPNEEKSSKMPLEWLNDSFLDEKERTNYIAKHELGDIPKELSGFNDWYKARRERMLGRLRGILGVPSTG
ncbi:MAG: hypothetical protein OXC83_02310 [Chloroflexi bacterium]|nr:hypothetical protein [Chloroflexota bacterium]